MPDSSQDFYKKLLGKKGERLAERYLRKQGYRLLKRNFRTPYGEADLIFSFKDEVVFVEVKTRSDANFAEARVAVNHDKQERYRKIAQFFGGGEEPNARFDVVEVYPDKIVHIENAF